MPRTWRRCCACHDRIAAFFLGEKVRCAGNRRVAPAVNVAQFVENFLQSLVAGLLTGSIYGLMCVGLSLIFGVMRVINFAHGDFMMLGMYVAYYAFALLGIQSVFGSTFGPYVAALLAGPVIFVV